jgi:hypothetical protein
MAVLFVVVVSEPSPLAGVQGLAGGVPIDYRLIVLKIQWNSTGGKARQTVTVGIVRGCLDE